MPVQWNAIRRLIPIVAGLLAPVVAVAQAPDPGTYRLWLCAQLCTPADSSRAIGVATVVIVSDQTADGESARMAFTRFQAIEYGSKSGTIDNVCFSVSHREPRVGGEELFFGIQPKGRTRWRFAPDTGFSLLVYHSPDAGYHLRWTGSGALAHGEGWSYGWSANTPYHRNAYFTALRTGEPDLTQCI